MEYHLILFYFTSFEYNMGSGFVFPRNSCDRECVCLCIHMYFLCGFFFFWYFPSFCLVLFRLSLLKIDFSLIQFILITISAPFIHPSSPATSPLLHSHLPLFSLQKTEVLQEETSKYDRTRNNKIRQIQARILKLD